MTTVYLWQYFTCIRKWEGRARQSDVNNSWLVESNLIQIDSPWPDLIRVNIRAGPFCNCDHRKALKIINVAVNLRAVTSLSRPLLPCSLSLLLSCRSFSKPMECSIRSSSLVPPRPASRLGTSSVPAKPRLVVQRLISLFLSWIPSLCFFSPLC